MSLRSHLNQIQRQGKLLQISEPVSKHLQAAGILKVMEPDSVKFQSIVESDFSIIGNLFCTKASFANYLGIKQQDIIPTLTRAIDEHTLPELSLIHI